MATGFLAYVHRAGDGRDRFPSSEFTDHGAGLGHGVLVMDVRGREVLVADFCRRDLVAVDEVRMGADVIGLAVEALRELDLAGGPVAVVGSDVLPLAAQARIVAGAPGTQLVGLDEPLRRMRRIKDEDEIRLLREAARVSEVGLRAALAAARVGATERDVCAAGTAAALAAGADFVRYLRVHTGPWSLHTSRWPQATGRAVESGDVVYLDLIGAVAGYQFDVLRTGAAGRPTPEVERLLEATVQVQDAVLAAVRPGARVGDLFAAAQRAADRLGFGEHLGPLLGHGIGLETVEAPQLLAGSDDVLAAGMVLCIEPTLRIPGVAGASVEDEVVVRPDGIERLTTMERRVWPQG